MILVPIFEIFFITFAKLNKKKSYPLVIKDTN